MTDDFPFKLDRIVAACGWSPPCQPYTTGWVADLKPLMIDTSRNVYEFTDVQTTVAVPGTDGEYPTVSFSAAYALADDLSAYMARLMADDGEYALVIDEAAQSVRIVDAARLLKEEGGAVVIIDSSRHGKTMRAEELFRRLDLPLKKERAAAAPDYLHHDPTKSHRRRRKRR